MSSLRHFQWLIAVVLDSLAYGNRGVKEAVLEALWPGINEGEQVDLLHSKAEFPCWLQLKEHSVDQQSVLFCPECVTSTRALAIKHWLLPVLFVALTHEKTSMFIECMLNILQHCVLEVPKVLQETSSRVVLQRRH